MSDFLKMFEGKVFDYYGVCGTCFKLNDLVFEAVEDPDDGYRSYLDSVILLEGDVAYTFYNQPICQVAIRANEIKGFDLVNTKTLGIMLEVGTSDWDDYYPCFVFSSIVPEISSLEKALSEFETDPLYSLHKLLEA